jgi:hypothetical protein
MNLVTSKFYFLSSLLTLLAFLVLLVLLSLLVLPSFLYLLSLLPLPPLPPSSTSSPPSSTSSPPHSSPSSLFARFLILFPDSPTTLEEMKKEGAEDILVGIRDSLEDPEEGREEEGKEKEGQRERGRKERGREEQEGILTNVLYLLSVLGNGEEKS